MSDLAILLMYAPVWGCPVLALTIFLCTKPGTKTRTVSLSSYRRRSSPRRRVFSRSTR